MSCALPISCEAVSPVYAQADIVTAGGEPIAEDDIVRRTRLISPSTHKPAERQDVINELAV